MIPIGKKYGIDAVFALTKAEDVDKDKCITAFDKCYNKEKVLIEWIKTNKIKVLNSGIKVA